MTDSSSHERFIRQALSCAQNAHQRTSPNPKVGCVIVRDGHLISEGVTQPVGGPHAEIVALQNAGDRAAGSTLYVTLEPCCHYGRTPPCTDAIIAAGIRRVVIGARDRNPRVDGGGISALRRAGIEVVTDVLTAECNRAHAPFFHFIEHGMPWTILKAAITIDGQIATENGDSKWITSEGARRDVHRTRARVDAVMVGGETARLDNPQLTVRLHDGTDPIRVILDSNLRLPHDGAWSGAGALIYCSPDASEDRKRAVQSTGSTVVPVSRNGVGLDLTEILHDLGSRGVVSLLVEGGGTLHAQLLTHRLVQAAQIYIAPRLLGQGRPLLNMASPERIADGWHLSQLSVRELGPDLCLEGLLEYPSMDSTQ